MESKMTSIVNLVMNCNYRQPLTGCILSDMKGKDKSEIKSSLRCLNEKGLERIISFHESCPYSKRLAI